MIKRIVFTIKKAVKHRKALKALMFEKSIMTIDWNKLYQSGIRVIVLDFDGVLAADKQEKIQDGVDVILKKILAIFGDHVYIFSNQPTLQRKAYFAEYFPQIQFLIAKKKPYPDGLLEVITREKVLPDELVLIDDRVLTGGLAAILSSVKCILIQKPFVCFSNNSLREILFISIRVLERLFFC